MLAPGPAAAAGAAPVRPAPDARPAAQARVGARAGRPGAGPRRRHRRQPGPPGGGAGGARRARPAARAARRVRDRLQRLLRADAQEPGALPAAGTGEARLGKATAALAEDLRDGLLAAGWVDLDNARARLKVDHREIELVGTDDPHIRATGTPRSPARPDPAADLSLGVTHAPYRRILDPMVADGFGAGPRRPHPRRPAVRARRRRAGDQLRPAPAAGQGAVDLVGAAGARPGCTCPPGWARRRTRRCGSPARRRPRC